MSRSVEKGPFVDAKLLKKVEVVIRDASTNKILFRSPVETLTPDRDRVDVVATALEGAVSARNTQLRVEVRDGATEKLLDSIGSTLAIDLTGW